MKTPLACNDDENLTLGTYVIRRLDLLVPKEPNCEQGIGGLVNIPIFNNFRSLKADIKAEELCEALTCQCPTWKEVAWIQCSDPKCGKWFHLHCVGLLEEDEEPESWFCELEKSTGQGCFRYILKH